MTSPAPPSAELLAEPPRFRPPPATVDPASGETVLTGRDGLPWALETLDTGGTIRARLLRLQAWVKAQLGVDAPAREGTTR